MRSPAIPPKIAPSWAANLSAAAADVLRVSPFLCQNRNRDIPVCKQIETIEIVINCEIVAATFFGLVDRVCPLEPLVEIFPVKRCLTDDECFPRICCPEGIEHRVSYCRTPTPNFEQFPGNAQFLQREYYSGHCLLDDFCNLF